LPAGDLGFCISWGSYYVAVLKGEGAVHVYVYTGCLRSGLRLQSRNRTLLVALRGAMRRGGRR
jgi:hypothetical protein